MSAGRGACVTPSGCRTCSSESRAHTNSACVVSGPMSSLEGWTRSEFTAGGVTHPAYRKGEGPGVIVIHEIPGITPQVQAFAEEVVAQGHTVVMPHLFGTPGAKVGPRS